MLFMAIPDDVAQDAEGHRITSYLALGDVKDGDQVKHNWLWTTIGKGTEAGEFDSFRVFVWSIKHHRYETAYIERNVTGYFPVASEPNPGHPDEAAAEAGCGRCGLVLKTTGVGIGWPGSQYLD